jgi:hypothetical protein
MAFRPPDSRRPHPEKTGRKEQHFANQIVGSGISAEKRA